MKKLEQYILDNVTISKDLEAQFIAFRIITKSSNIVEYVENRLVQQQSIFHNSLKDDLSDIFGNFLILAMHYVPKKRYTKEIDDIITISVKPEMQVELASLFASINHIIYTTSEILNIMSDKVENELYISQLIMDGIKQCYTLYEFAGIDILEIRDQVYTNRETSLRTTLQILDDITNNKNSKSNYTLVDLIIDQGKYVGIKLIDTVKPISYESGDIIKDFFTCTKNLRDKKRPYKYSSKLFEHFRTAEEIEQAYIFKGQLRFQSSITDEELKVYEKNEERFEIDFHHILVNQATSSMDDFLDYLYDK